MTRFILKIFYVFIFILLSIIQNSYSEPLDRELNETSIKARTKAMNERIVACQKETNLRLKGRLCVEEGMSAVANTEAQIEENLSSVWDYQRNAAYYSALKEYAIKSLLTNQFEINAYDGEDIQLPQECSGNNELVQYVSKLNAELYRKRKNPEDIRIAQQLRVERQYLASLTLVALDKEKEKYFEAANYNLLSERSINFLSLILPSKSRLGEVHGIEVSSEIAAEKAKEFNEVRDAIFNENRILAYHDLYKKIATISDKSSVDDLVATLVEAKTNINKNIQNQMKEICESDGENLAEFSNITDAVLIQNPSFMPTKGQISII